MQSMSVLLLFKNKVRQIFLPDFHSCYFINFLYSFQPSNTPSNNPAPVEKIPANFMDGVCMDLGLSGWNKVCHKLLILFSLTVKSVLSSDFLRCMSSSELYVFLPASINIIPLRYLQEI